MNNENEWTDFEKGMDEKYLSANRVLQKKKRWIIGLIFALSLAFSFLWTWLFPLHMNV
jgi:hypothetical protein